MKARFFWITLLLLATGALGFYLAKNLEFSEQEIYVGYQGEARTNDFLAAQRLLERLGHPARCMRGLPSGKHLPDPKDVLILPRRRVRITRTQAKELLAWVDRGGMLVAAGAWIESAPETQDPLFAELGARLVRAKWGGPPVNTNEPQDDEPTPMEKDSHEGHNPPSAREKPVPLPIPVPEKPTPLATPVRVNDVEALVEFSIFQVLEDRGGKAVDRVAGDRGIQVLHYVRGRGDVFLFSDLAFLANDRIAASGHGDFLGALPLRRDPGHRVWIMYREDAPGFLSWLWSKAWPAMVALLAMVLGAALRYAPRFGPLLPEPALARRSLAEHLTACGRFQWKHGEGRELLTATREATLKAAFQAHPAWSRLSPDDLSHALAERAGLSESRVFWALRFERAADPLHFTQAIQALDLIRKKL